jgi:PmbA protein
MGEVETMEHHRDKGLGVTVYKDHCKGSASTTDFSHQAIRQTVEAACNIAHHTNPDPCAGLVEPELLATEIPDLDLFHPWDLRPEEAIAIAKQCEDSARGQDARIRNSDGATVNSHRGIYAYGNSNGFLGGWASSRASISCAVIAEEPSGMQRDYWMSVSRNPEQLENHTEVGVKAAQRALRRLGARQLSTRKVPVLFEARIASGLFSHFINAISGGSLYRKVSFLLDQLGKQIFPPYLRIHEQPHLKQALGSAPFDNDGVATKPRDIVKDGILKGYVLSAYSARKLGMQTTGNAGGVHNLIIEPGEHDFGGLLKKMHTGLLITELMGFGVNGVTGDYSRGASGFWIEGGEIRFPVEEVTIASNLKDMFMGIVAIGKDVDLCSNIRTGSVLIENMTVAGA